LSFWRIPSSGMLTLCGSCRSLKTAFFIATILKTSSLTQL
jgi:hypothetical protein